jgi:5-formyltetrahydrofolate cyclo-ligase
MSPGSKPRLRTSLLHARRALSPAVHDAEALALAQNIATLAHISETVCAYVPIGTEPGSPALLDVLNERAARVLLPIAVSSSDGVPLPLQWARYRPGELAPARFGLLEPRGPRLPADTLAGAAVIIVPALAVDRCGGRLGRGAGFYDRSLPLRNPAARLVAIVRDDEFVDELPVEPHDVRMTDVVTPGLGVVTLREQG